MSFVAVAIGGSAVAGLVGGALSSSAAKSAANTQAQASDYAANLQNQLGNRALDIQQQNTAYNQALAAPGISSGYTALRNLNYLLGLPEAGQFNSQIAQPPAPTSTNPYGSGIGPDVQAAPAYSSVRAVDGAPEMQRLANPDALIGPDGKQIMDTGGGQFTPPAQTTTNPTGAPVPIGNVNTALGPYGSLSTGFNEQFVAPTDVTEQNDPGYQFRLNQGLKAIQAGAAAKGNLFSGGTLKSLNDYAQNQASNEYGNVYNRAFNEYAQRYNIANNNSTNQFNRLSTLAGMGQTQATNLGYLNNAGAQNSGNILMNTGAQIGNDVQNAAAARASGYVGSANAWNGALSGVGGSLSTLALLQKLNGGSTGGTYPSIQDIGF